MGHKYGPVVACVKGGAAPVADLPLTASIHTRPPVRPVRSRPSDLALAAARKWAIKPWFWSTQAKVG